MNLPENFNNILPLGVIGAGKMGKAIISGIIRSNCITPNDIYVYDKEKSQMDYLVQKYSMINTTGNIECIFRTCPVVLLLVQPADVDSMREWWINDKTHTIASLCASVSIWDLQIVFKGANVLRFMTNIAVEHCEGATAITKEGYCPLLFHLFSNLGICRVIEEKQMDITTGICGSSPALILHIVNSLAEGGVYNGLPKETALDMVTQTFIGTLKFLQQAKTHPSELKDKVCTPGGITIHAMQHVYRKSLKSILIDFLNKAMDKTAAMKKN